ncbi:xanthine dehydrogenase family protein molybdopterin-binding subunit [Pseudohongiella sp.]|uniref:Aldehyde oxidase/xanthine dehydrogenase a/b hammerhead domain-containing protein n=1 Tax=marine sediment metagenome TaxID=412755 RepID=A0A0F9YQI2_9ZZZZ|nr:xanthine dehydrogenase family protein molybdopterin-binding subunit [Pseudohongiella sp.]HDZ10177.1 xanthine dehydrogenase family protein molybdopterin-binding subunit [Pseudohongiella sp.]HEA64292.1 xanthine dehydrogenase family protein molybdopterin-binding subunit [Pseudohongiella sp.]
MKHATKKPLRSVGTRPVRPDGIDKVTGRALFSADFNLPDALHGAVLRSPFAHARILSIDTTRALALAGVKAVVTASDMPAIPDDKVMINAQPPDFRDMSANILAREKVLYEGHAIAAVAAKDAETANRALQLIDIEYEVLPHVIDVQQAMEPGAPLLHENLITKGINPAPVQASNIASRHEQVHGDVELGFAQADIILTEEFTTQPVHQGYIEPHACLARVASDGQTEIWCSSQGQFMVRAYCARLLDMPLSQIRVMPLEIGGGFGGKTTVYLEPLAVLLSRKSGLPVKMQMSRADVFRATGPAPGSYISMKIGARKDGTLVAAQGILCYQAGAFAGSPVRLGCMTAFAPYDIANVKLIGYDIVVNRPKSAAYRAPGAPMASFAAESLIDMLAQRLDMDPIDLRIRNAAREGTRTAYGPSFKEIGYLETLEAARAHPHYAAPLGKNQGRGVASGFWFNIGGQSSAALTLNEDGTVMVATGNPDIGGSRASMALMAAEVLQIDVSQVRPQIVDTSSIAYSDLTGGSRVTFAVGMAVIQAASDMVVKLQERAATLWDVSVEHVRWQDGCAVTDVEGREERLSLAALAAQTAKTGGPIAAHVSLNAQGAGPGFGTHICDVEVDPDTGRVTVLRYTAVQDVGKAVHPSYVEGQLQGGAAQGIGWALNEAYMYDENGAQLNPGFLDYRVPVASDLPMIDTVLVEVPNPRHPFGVRGVGEVPIIPPLGAVANAVSRASGVRHVDLPMSPPAVLKAIQRAARRRR